MIKANDLRPGNYIYKLRDIGQTQYEKVLFQVASIDDRDGHLENYDFDSTTTEFSEPIPLAPEILEQCSIKKYTNSTHVAYQLDEFLYIVRSLDNTYFIVRVAHINHYFVDYQGEICDNIKYLHQLQNCYYCLTQTELQIKLPATV